MENQFENFKEFLKNDLKPLMKSLGFKISSQHFFIENDDMIKYVSIQKFSTGMKDYESFRFNIGIFDKTAQKNLSEFHTIPKIPRNSLFTIIETSLNELQKGKSDTYVLNNDTNKSEFKNLIFDDIKNIIFPFIQKIDTKKDLLELYKSSLNKNGFIGAGIFLNLAIGFLEIETGNKQRGLNIIKKWINEELEGKYWTDMAIRLNKKIFKN